MKRKNKRTVTKKTGVKAVFLLVPSIFRDVLKVTGQTDSNRTGGHIFIDLMPPFDDEGGKTYEPAVFCFSSEIFKTKEGFIPDGLKQFEVTPDMITNKNGVFAQYIRYMYGHEI